VAEGLSSLIVKAEQEGKLSGVPVSAGGYHLTHIFFADDSLLFCRAASAEWGNLLQILETCEVASVKKLNAQNTSIFFSKDTKEEFKDFILTSASIGSSSCYEKYLGLPTLVVRSKRKTFEGIQSRIRRKLDGWKEKFLSQVGKEILLKAMVQAIPACCMSVFQLPKKLCSNLNSLMSRFWWGRSMDAKNVAWMSWTRLGASKKK
jgi:hypothetical protein